MFDSTKPIYFMQGAGVYRSDPPRRVADFDTLMRAYAKDAPVHVKNAFVHEDAEGVEHAVSLVIRPNKITAHVTFTTLFIDTTYTIVNGALLPMFTNDSNFFRNKCRYTCPVGMSITFGVHFLKDGDCYLTDHAVLFARKSGVAGFWKLPLPNTFDDGKMCLGSSWPTGNLHHTISPQFSDAANRLFEGRWNADLIGDRATIHAMFRFSPEGYTSLPSTVEWTNCCRRVNNNTMAEIFP